MICLAYPTDNKSEDVSFVICKFEEVSEAFKFFFSESIKQTNILDIN